MKENIMSVNIYDVANQLESAVRNSDEYAQIKALHDAVNTNAESKKIFEDFRQIQLSLQEKQLSGQEITEEDINKAQSTAELIEKDENISKLMQAEQRMSVIIQDINRIVMKPLEELYGMNEAQGE